MTSEEVNSDTIESQEKLIRTALLEEAKKIKKENKISLEAALSLLVFVELKKIHSHLDEEQAFAIPIENGDEILYKTEITWRQFFDDALIIICICGSIAVALKFVTYFDHWVFFPGFPNALDSVFIIFSAVYLAVRLLKYRKMCHR